ncbi:MAG TPA: hypothetical protein VF818_03665 [Ktedonobacterales bacterium]
MEAANNPFDVLEEVTTGTSPAANDEVPVTEGEERREEAFEATIVRLDRKAAEALFRLAGL